MNEMTVPARDTIFISKATPQDDNFVLVENTKCT